MFASAFHAYCLYACLLNRVFLSSIEHIFFLLLYILTGRTFSLLLFIFTSCTCCLLLYILTGRTFCLLLNIFTGLTFCLLLYIFTGSGATSGGRTEFRPPSAFFAPPPRAQTPTLFTIIFDFWRSRVGGGVHGTPLCCF